MQIKVKPDLMNTARVQTMKFPIILDATAPKILSSYYHEPTRSFYLYDYEELG